MDGHTTTAHAALAYSVARQNQIFTGRMHVLFSLSTVYLVIRVMFQFYYWPAYT